MDAEVEVNCSEGPFHLLTHRRALLNFSYVILSFFFLCPHIFARASDLTTRKMPCPLSSHSRMPPFSSGERRRSLTNSHKWELCRSGTGRRQLFSRFFLIHAKVPRQNYIYSTLCHQVVNLTVWLHLPGYNFWNFSASTLSVDSHYLLQEKINQCFSNACCVRICLYSRNFIVLHSLSCHSLVLFHSSLTAST